MPGVWGPTAGAQAKPSTCGTYANARERGAGILIGGKTYALLRDHIGSVRLVVDVQTGAVAQRLGYDEFGRVMEDTNPGFQPFGFAGGLYDAVTGFVHFGARVYDENIGRWLSKDPIGFDGAQSNLYVLANNDPLNNSDPTGKAVNCNECQRIAVGYGIGCSTLCAGMPPPANFACWLYCGGSTAVLWQRECKRRCDEEDQFGPPPQPDNCDDNGKCSANECPGDPNQSRPG